MIENLSTDKIFSELLPQLIESNPDVVQRIRAVINFELTGREPQQWIVDLNDNPGVRMGLANKAKCSVSVSRDLFEELITQKNVKSWLDAYKSKRIEVKGHLPTILKIERLIYSQVKT